jgi:hypothetical protein
MNGAPEVVAWSYVWASRPQPSPHNRAMRSFLFAHAHWLWVVFHYVRHDIYAPWTFAVVVFIGLAQAAIGWESGELAVKALTQDLLSDKDRKRYLRLVRILAFLLFPATVFVGLVNDRSQRDADDKALQARADQGVTQLKLDEANTRARHYDESFDTFVKSLDPNKLTVAQFEKLLKAKQDAAHLTSSSNINDPLSSMENKDLRDAIHELVVRVHRTNIRMFDIGSDIVNRQTRIRLDKESGLTDSQDLQQGLNADRTEFNELMNSMLQADIPLANLYLAELLMRLGPQDSQIVSFSAVPDLPSINTFAMKVMLLDDFAQKLSSIQGRNSQLLNSH